MVAYALVGTAFIQLALSLVTQRETGQLKRYRGTPVPVWTFIVATVLRVAVMAGGITAILLLIARIAYGVDISGAALAEIAVYVVLGTATLCSAGIAATTVATDVESASAALPVIAVLLSFVSSIFVPVDQLPGWLAEIGRIFPLYHVATGVQTALGVSGGHVAARQRRRPGGLGRGGRDRGGPRVSLGAASDGRLRRAGPASGCRCDHPRAWEMTSTRSVDLLENASQARNSPLGVVSPLVGATLIASSA